MSANRPQLSAKIIGSSGPMTKLRDEINKAAASDATTLVIGESGTGKESIAKAIHEKSRRNDRPFIAIVCSEFPESLLESELFGIEGRVATGVDARKGKFELANGGTVFLDEIHTTSSSAQVKLLRFLQERAIRRVGTINPESMQLDIRVLVATNQNLKQLIQDGKFREDLFYRLAVLIIEAPPLRDHIEDIRELALDYVAKCAVRDGKQVPKISEGAITLLAKERWPGNVREMQNVIDRAVSDMGASEAIIDERIIAAAIGKPCLLNNLGQTSGANPTESVDVIANLVFDDLCNQRVPLEGIKNGSEAVGAVAECLINGFADGFRQFLETDRGKKQLESLNPSDLLSRIGLSSRRGGSNALFICKLRHRLTAIIQGSKSVV